MHVPTEQQKTDCLSLLDRGLQGVLLVNSACAYRAAEDWLSVFIIGHVYERICILHDANTERPEED